MARKHKDESWIIEGAAAAIIATLLAAGVVFLLARFAPGTGKFLLPAIVGIGVTQLVYLVPISVAFAYFGRRRAIIGVVLVAAVVFLLNAACYGLVVFKR